MCMLNYICGSDLCVINIGLLTSMYSMHLDWISKYLCMLNTVASYMHHVLNNHLDACKMIQNQVHTLVQVLRNKQTVGNAAL